jgi:metallo-beta-lactamase class B
MRKLIGSIVFICLLVLSTATQAQGDELHDPEVQRVEPFQVFDNLYYIGVDWVASWLLVTDQGLIVFDALYEELTDLMIDNIRHLGFDPNDIRYLIGSHAHFDHIGGAIRFQQEFNAVVMMTEEDWAMTEEPAVYRDYPKPIRHLSASDGATLNLGRTRLRFMKTPGHTPGVLSTLFTVYDNGYPHSAFMFGGVGLNFSGVERTEMYIQSIKKMQQLTGIDVNIPNHASSADVFARRDMLAERQDGDLHPFVDPEGWTASLDLWLRQAEQKLEAERAAAN